MKEYKTILFDLDGTITDPKEGITRSVQYALQKMNIAQTNLNELIPFIGPPLQVVFKENYHFNEEQIQQAIHYYRERFKQQGMFENEVYEGMEELLKQLQNNGFQLAVATSKPTEFAEQILQHFHLSQYFDVIVGSHLDGRRIAKGEVIQAVCEFYGPQLGTAIMIGDREHDIIGAVENDMDSIGVLFGYGTEYELKTAGATYIVSTVQSLQRLLLE